MIDWMVLKKEIQIFLIVLLSVILVVGFVSFFHNNELRQWEKAKRDLVQARVKYNQAKDKQKLIGLYRKEFADYKSKGIYGDEQRINWVETIQHVADEHRIPSVKVNIRQRIKLDMSEYPDMANGIDIYASTMTLDFELVHEGDLFTLLKDLDNKGLGLYGIKSCNIKNNFKDLNSVVDSRTAANFSGECELTWYTIEKESFQDENLDQGGES